SAARRAPGDADVARAPARATAPEPGERPVERGFSPDRSWHRGRSLSHAYGMPLLQPLQPASVRLWPGLIAYFGAFSLFALARSPSSQSNRRTIADKVSPRLT